MNIILLLLSVSASVQAADPVLSAELRRLRLEARRNPGVQAAPAPWLPPHLQPVPGLWDQSDEVRAAALRALRPQAKTLGTWAAVVDRLGDRSPQVRFEAAKSLASAPTYPGIAAALAGQALHDSDPQVRRASYMALSGFTGAGPDVAAFLMRVASDPRFPADDRRGALWALSSAWNKTDNQALANVLLNSAVNGDDALLREQAMRSLYGGMHYPYVRERAGRLIASTDPAVAKPAILLFSRLDSLQRERAFREASISPLLNTEHAATVRAAAFSLQAHGTPELSMYFMQSAFVDGRHVPAIEFEIYKKG